MLQGLIDSQILYGIDVQMKSNKGKPCTLEVTHQTSVLTISFNTQVEAQKLFIAFKQIIGKEIKFFVSHQPFRIGCFHLHLKISLLNIPEDLVVQVEGDSMTSWSVKDDNKCMEWKLSDIKTVSLINALYICVKSLGKHTQ